MFSVISSPVQERGISGFFQDNVIRARLNRALGGDGFSTLEVMVYKGKVLLMGLVKDGALKAQAQALVQQVQGVKEVLNEIEVVKEPPSSYPQDAYLGEKLRSLLFFDPRILSQNYHIRVIGRVAYILGLAQNVREKDLVLRYAEGLTLRRVVPYIDLSENQEKEANLGKATMDSRGKKAFSEKNSPLAEGGLDEG